MKGIKSIKDSKAEQETKKKKKEDKTNPKKQDFLVSILSSMSTLNIQEH